MRELEYWKENYELLKSKWLELSDEERFLRQKENPEFVTFVREFSDGYLTDIGRLRPEHCNLDFLYASLRRISDKYAAINVAFKAVMSNIIGIEECVVMPRIGAEDGDVFIISSKISSYESYRITIGCIGGSFSWKDHPELVTPVAVKLSYLHAKREKLYRILSDIESKMCDIVSWSVRKCKVNHDKLVYVDSGGDRLMFLLNNTTVGYSEIYQAKFLGKMSESMDLKNITSAKI